MRPPSQTPCRLGARPRGRRSPPRALSCLAAPELALAPSTGPTVSRRSRTSFCIREARWRASAPSRTPGCWRRRRPPNPPAASPNLRALRHPGSLARRPLRSRTRPRHRAPVPDRSRRSQARPRRKRGRAQHLRPRPRRPSGPPAAPSPAGQCRRCGLARGRRRRLRPVPVRVPAPPRSLAHKRPSPDQPVPPRIRQHPRCEPVKARPRRPRPAPQRRHSRPVAERSRALATPAPQRRRCSLGRAPRQPRRPAR